MLDVDNLLTTIISTANAEDSLSAVHGKIYFGLGLQGVVPSRPHVRVGLIGAPPQQAYGHMAIDKLLVTFSTFASTLSTANAIAKALGAAFANGNVLSLTDQTNVHARRMGGRVGIEGTDPKNIVYRSDVDVEFWVSS